MISRETVHKSPGAYGVTKRCRGAQWTDERREREAQMLAGVCIWYEVSRIILPRYATQKLGEIQLFPAFAYEHISSSLEGKTRKPGESCYYIHCIHFISGYG